MNAVTIPVTIPEALTTNTVGFISIGNLARLIEAPVERLRPLVEHGYLRVVTPDNELEQILVARPGQRATEWLHKLGPIPGASPRELKD